MSMQLRVVLVLMILLFSNTADSTDSIEEVHVYTETRGDRTFRYVWKKVHSRGMIKIIVSLDNNQYYENIYNPEGDTIKWLHRTETRDIRAARDGDEIIIRGTDQGKTLNKILKIDSDKWCQSMTFSLRELVSGSGKDVDKFWVVRQDNLEAVKMKAKRRGTENLDFMGDKLQVDRVVVTIDNKLLSKLWHGDYWFRKKDNLFVQYKGSDGPPFTSETVIRLKQEDITD